VKSVRSSLRALVPAWLLVMGCAACTSGGCGHDVSARAEDCRQTPDRVEFPLAYSADQRYLTDRRGVAFPILGRASWLIVSLPQAEYRRYLEDTTAKGFNVIELTAVSRIADGHRAPFDGRGDAPFLRRLDGKRWDGHLAYRHIEAEAPDFTTPNPDYWSYVDELLDYCAAHGIAVLMFPAYVGYAGTDQGWMREMLANGATRMQRYGAWIAERYRDRANIVWMLGGDRGTPPFPFSAEELGVERALVAGLDTVPGQQSRQYSAEWSGPLASSLEEFAPHITLDGSYGPETAANGRLGYSRDPIRPAFLLEGPYDEEGPDGNYRNVLHATQPVRRFLWWGWLNSIGGYVAGNGYVWPFDRGSRLRLRARYLSHLDTQNTTDLAHLNALIRSISWYALVPDGLAPVGVLVTEGRGTPDAAGYVAAAASPDGRLLLAYAGPGAHHAFRLDMTRMRGPVTARWFNPTTGAYTSLGTLPNRSTHEFMPPGDNGTGYDDWALILSSP
jgi:hypothetical protein